jgi:oligosaccharide translocation protein RFT1
MSLMPSMSFASQGVYDVVSNLGSLVIRLLFLPVEQSYYALFCALLTRADDDDDDDDDEGCVGGGVGNGDGGSSGAKRQLTATQSADFAVAVRVFGCVSKAVLLVGLVIAFMGQPYAHTLLHLYGGSRLAGDNTLCRALSHYATFIIGGVGGGDGDGSGGIVGSVGGDAASDGPSLLRAYCVYVLLCALNGVGEALFSAAASRRRLDAYNGRLAGISIAFLTAAWVFTQHFGAIGFIAANCINMALRIAHSLRFIQRWVDTNRRRAVASPSSSSSSSSSSRVPAVRSGAAELFACLPAAPVIAACTVALVVTAASEARLIHAAAPLRDRIAHVAVGAVATAAVVFVIFVCECAFVADFRHYVLGKKQILNMAASRAKKNE